MKKTTIGIAIAMVLLAAFFIKVGFSKSSDSDKKGGKDKSQKKVSAYIIKTSELVNEIMVSGSLIAYDEVELKNEVSGRIVELNLPEGKMVKKGTLLVKLFDDDLQATLSKLEAQLSVKQQIFKRQAELLQVNGVSQNTYDETGLGIKTLKADIDAQKAAIRKTEIRAPFDGVIGLRNISMGAIVTPSTLLATIRTDNKIKLDFSVPEKYGSVVNVGMKVNFTMNNGQNNFLATVIATEKGIDASTRNLKVRALVNSKSTDLIPGAFANVTLKLGENKNALLIPTASIIPQEDNKKVIVARQGKAHFVKIKTGVRQPGLVEVIDGLQVGDTLITTGVQFLREDAKLNYAKISTEL